MNDFRELQSIGKHLKQLNNSHLKKEIPLLALQNNAR